MSDSSSRKATPSAMAAALTVLASGYSSAYSALVPSVPLSGYGIAGALQAVPIDNLFGIARGLTPAAGPWLKYQARVADVAEPGDVAVLQALAEVDHHQLVAAAVIERHTGGHTLH